MKIMQLDRFAMLHQSVGKGILLGLETREQKRRTFETSFETLKTLTSKCLQESLCLTQLLMKPHISSATTNISAHDTNLRLFGDILERNQKLKTCIWTRILRYNLKVGKIKKALNQG